MSVYIIAEAGDNHNGIRENAFDLVDRAVDAKADCVKFQVFVTEEIISREAKKAEYQIANTGSNESQFEMVKNLELPFSVYEELFDYCKEKNIDFLATPFDLPSVSFLDKLGQSRFKIPSGEITNYPLLVAVAKTKKPIIMSTGMCTLKEIEDAFKVLKDNGAEDITLLQCNTQYPTPYEDVNLKAMNTLKKVFNTEVGFSDHTLGNIAPIAAVSMGASVIEKHFTLDKNMEGPDHKASLNPYELTDMVRAIRNTELLLGNGKKAPSKSEKENIDIARKSIVARKDIKKGEILGTENLAVKRPGTGISPMKWEKILGTVANKNYEQDEMIEI